MKQQRKRMGKGAYTPKPIREPRKQHVLSGYQKIQPIINISGKCIQIQMNNRYVKIEI